MTRVELGVLVAAGIALAIVFRPAPASLAQPGPAPTASAVNAYARSRAYFERRLVRMDPNDTTTADAIMLSELGLGFERVHALQAAPVDAAYRTVFSRVDGVADVAARRRMFLLLFDLDETSADSVADVVHAGSVR